MKQLLLLILLMVFGSVGTLYHAFWGLLLYYTLAVLRPQHLWDWALPVEWRWSFSAAMIVFVGVFMNLPKIVQPGRINRIAILMAVYGGWLLLSCLTAYNPAVAHSWAIEYAKVLVIAVIASFVLDHISQIRLFGLMMMLVLGYLAWEVNSLYFFDGRLDIFHVGFDGLDNNGAGLMLAMGTPFAYAYAVSGTRRWLRIASAIAGLMMLHAVMMTYSRGAMISVIVGIVFVLWHHRPRIQSIAIVFLLCFAVSIMAGPEIRNRFMSASQFNQDKSAQSRLDSWSAAWAIACEHPITGQGIRNSNIYLQNYGADMAGRTVHSQYLQIAADTGIPAMLVYIAMLTLALVNFSRCRRWCDEMLDNARLSLTETQRGEVRLTRNIVLACHASLVIFAFGGLFLSMEMFELPWLLMMIAGVLPRLLGERLDAIEAGTGEQADADDKRPAARRPVLPMPDLVRGLNP